MTTAAELDQQIGERTHRIMWRMRISQSVLAQQIEVDPSTISKKLHGERPFYAAELVKVAKFLNVTVGELYGEDAAPTPADPAGGVMTDCSRLLDLDRYRERHIHAYTSHLALAG